MCWSLFVIKLQSFRPKKRIQHRCFPVNIAKFLRAAILKNLYERLLLKLDRSVWVILIYWNCVILKKIRTPETVQLLLHYELEYDIEVSYPKHNLADNLHWWIATWKKKKASEGVNHFVIIFTLMCLT